MCHPGRLTAGTYKSLIWNWKWSEPNLHFWTWNPAVNLQGLDRWTPPCVLPCPTVGFSSGVWVFSPPLLRRGYETPKSLEPLSCATEYAEQVKAAAKSVQAAKAALKEGGRNVGKWLRKCCGEMRYIVWYNTRWYVVRGIISLPRRQYISTVFIYSGKKPASIGSWYNNLPHFTRT